MHAFAWLPRIDARRHLGWRRLAAALVLAAWMPSALAIDPIVLFLLRSLRDRIILSAANAIVEDAMKSGESQPTLQPLPALPGMLPPDEEYRRLRTVIDDSFLYLSSEQRDQVHKALVQRLSDPKNAAMRAQAISDFQRMAAAVRQTYLRLDELSDAEKRRIADELGDALQEATPEERAQIAGMLRGGQLPVPPDLNAMLLAELASVR